MFGMWGLSVRGGIRVEGAERQWTGDDILYVGQFGTVLCGLCVGECVCVCE